MRPSSRGEGGFAGKVIFRIAPSVLESKREKIIERSVVTVSGLVVKGLRAEKCLSQSWVFLNDSGAASAMISDGASERTAK